jgi:hypothetical protein
MYKQTILAILFLAVSQLAHAYGDPDTRGMQGTVLKGKCEASGQFHTGPVGDFELQFSAADPCPYVNLSIQKFVPGAQDIHIEYQARDGATPTIANGNALFMLEGPHIGSHLTAQFNYPNGNVLCEADVIGAD